MTALLLAGHGSHLDPCSSTPVHEHARRIRELGRYDEVCVAFWKEEPALSRALDGCTATTDVTVVPVFISGGYFTREVLPRELGLDGRITCRDGMRIRYADPIGAHPRLADVIAARAREAGARPEDAVVVLGHGTPRNPSSERNIYARADDLRANNAFAEVAAAFIEQEPNVANVFELVSASTVVVVPFFVADGWHVGQTIPADLALDGPELRRDGRTLRYAAPVGTHPRVAEVILNLAEEAEAW